MPRIEFEDKGEPIPQLALPPFGGDDAIPPTVLTFAESTDFSVLDYRNLGFTHFEAWCVGGAGGRGGSGAHDLIWPSYLVGPQKHYHDPIPDVPVAYGGAGGGGGLHRAQGLLADLPDSCPIVVGQAGVDAPIGLFTIHVNDPYLDEWSMAPVLAPFTPLPQDHLLGYASGDLYDLPHPEFGPPVDGGDGGVSSFNGATCRASGGKGGKGAGHFDSDMMGPLIGPNRAIIYDGDGGAGGVGDQAIAGGGAVGGSITAVMNLATSPKSVTRYDTVVPPDGTLIDDIGAGGGGGYGGIRVPSSPPGGTDELRVLASSGSRGSYSFADTSVSGAKEFRNGDANAVLIVPGSGGGARPLSNWKVGSRAPGYSPNGVVILRLTKIT